MSEEQKDDFIEFAKKEMNLGLRNFRHHAESRDKSIVF